MCACVANRERNMETITTSLTQPNHCTRHTRMPPPAAHADYIKIPVCKHRKTPLGGLPRLVVPLEATQHSSTLLMHAAQCIQLRSLAPVLLPHAPPPLTLTYRRTHSHPPTAALTRCPVLYVQLALGQLTQVPWGRWCDHQPAPPCL